MSYNLEWMEQYSVMSNPGLIFCNLILQGGIDWAMVGFDLVTRLI